MLRNRETALLVVAAVLIAAGPTPAALHIEEIHTVDTPFDAREGFIEPSPAALDRVAALGATARWTRFGTVRTLHVPGGVLDAGLTGEPPAAARDWIRTNRELFGLSEAAVDTLELRRDSPLEDGSGRVLLFRQTVDGVPVGGEGAIKVGMVDGGVFWAASSSIGDATSLAAPAISPEDAWLTAAADLGLALAPGDVLSGQEEAGWHVLEVVGLSHPQRARLVALGIPGAGAVPVEATHLALEVLHNKCTGTPAYHGYLGIPGNDDADPLNGTDCRTGSPPLIGPKNVDVRVAELQAFGSEGRVRLRRGH